MPGMSEGWSQGGVGPPPQILAPPFSVNLSVNLSGEPYLLTLFANLQFFLHKVAFEIHFEEKVRVRVRSATVIK